MTSILISSFKQRERASTALQRNYVDDCTFCAIIRGQLPAFKVYEDEETIAFLDILPIRRGHTLLVPKDHHEKMTTLPDDISAHMARILPRLCRAICDAVEQKDFNIVNNNGYAQVVPHVHWHIVPAPHFNQRTEVPKSTSLPIGLQEPRHREELDDEDAQQLAKQIAAKIADEAKSRL